MSDKHTVFVSFCHDDDQGYKEEFQKLSEDITISRSVEPDDIDPTNNADYIMQQIRDKNLRNSTVTVVLIGKRTWQRKYVDWEIYSSLRDTKTNSRSGLIGIFLPTHPDYGKANYNRYTIPPRLYDNAKENPEGQRYASLHHWSNNSSQIRKWIEQAYAKRESVKVDLHRDLFGRNHSGDRWYD